MDTPPLGAGLFIRRDLLKTASVSALAIGGASTAMAQDPGKPGMPPTQWSDAYGPVANLPKDKDPLTKELEKYPRDEPRASTRPARSQAKRAPARLQPGVGSAGRAGTG